MSWPGKSVNPNFQHYQSDNSNNKLLIAWIKNGWTDLFFHLKPFKITLKPNWYLTSVLCHDLLNLSSPTFGNINLTKSNLLIAWKLNEKWLKYLCFHPNPFKITLKPNSYLTSVLCRGPVNLLTPTFPNINLTQAMSNFLIVWKIT